MTPLVFESWEDDYWTCDHWSMFGVWTSKAYALIGAFDKWWGEYKWSFMGQPRIDGNGVKWGTYWINRRRLCCGTMNEQRWSRCRRCGFPRYDRARGG